MAAARWVFLPVALLCLEAAGAHEQSRSSPGSDHREEIETCYVSDGYIFVLRCYIAGADVNVTWRKGGTYNGSLPAGVEVRGGLLFFLPAHMSHHGSYTCEKRDKAGTKMKFWVSVSNGECPDPSEEIHFARGVNGGIRCKQTDIFRLNNTGKIRWMKDCRPVEREQSPISVDKDSFMRLPAASESDAGKYTCLVDVKLDGRVYTSARSIQLTIKDRVTSEFFSEPEVVYPQQTVVTVEVGSRAELKCLVNIGHSEDSEILTYWSVGLKYPEDYKEFKESWTNFSDDSSVYRASTLYISEVLRQFLNVSFYCHIMSSAYKKVGSVRLQEADHSAFHTLVALCFTASLTVLALVVVFILFKEELVLASRKLWRHFPKRKASDGKLYDAYVSFLHHDASAETETFALQILPEELEKQYGYSLYIRGRDDQPGEVMYEAISAAICRCCRLIIILSPDAKSSASGREEEEASCDYHNQIYYEQRLGLHEALTQNDPKVILLEIGGPVDYSRLTESLRYIKRKQGSLRWKKPSSGAHKLTKLFLKRRFWNKLRCCMPSVPVGRLRTVTDSSY
ncbi:interleukin-1 receptor type 1 isoform X2 [Antennarius striatus]